MEARKTLQVVITIMYTYSKSYGISRLCQVQLLFTCTWKAGWCSRELLRLILYECRFSTTRFTLRSQGWWLIELDNELLLHFRTAEYQFYVLLCGRYSCSCCRACRIFIINSSLVKLWHMSMSILQTASSASISWNFLELASRRWLYELSSTRVYNNAIHARFFGVLALWRACQRLSGEKIHWAAPLCKTASTADVPSPLMNGYACFAWLG